MGKDPTKHSSTKVSTIGQGTAAVPTFTLVNTAVGARTFAGTVTNLKDKMTTATTVFVASVVKYVNVCIEVGPTQVTGDVPTPPDNGWLEFGIVKTREEHTVPAVTNLGTRFLGDILTTSYRGDVIHTGCVPIGSQQPTAIELKIKLPKIFCKMQQGSKLILYFWYRSVDATDVRTNSHRVITSVLFKSYD